MMIFVKTNRQAAICFEQYMLAGVRLPSAYYISMFLLFSAYSAGSANLAQEASQKGDIEVTVSLDVAEQSGSANATVRIHASREVVWSLITSCPESMRMVPGLEACDVLETARISHGREFAMS